MPSQLPEDHHPITYVPGEPEAKYVVRTKYPGRDQCVEDKVLSVDELANKCPEHEFFGCKSYIRDYSTWEVWKVVPASMPEFCRDLSQSRRDQTRKDNEEERARLKAEIKQKQAELKRLGD